MKNISRIILIVLGCWWSVLLAGQDIQLSVIATPPHPSLLSEFQESTDNYRLTITNINLAQEHNIILRGRLTSNNGVEAQLNEEYDNYEIVNIPAGSTQIYTFEELGSFFNDITLDDIDYSGGPDVDYLIQSQRLPDGIYNVCMEARDFDSRDLLSLGMEANCSNPIIIQSINPPTIVTPSEDDIIAQTQPAFFNISWTPVVAPSASIVYDLRIAEFNELVNAYDAIENDNFLQHEETDLRTNIFVYNQAHTPLVEGRRYIVRVRARDENRSVNIFNQGWSDIVIFTFGEIDLVDEDGDNDLDQQDNGNYSCMAPCRSIELPNVPAIPSIFVGEIFKIGHFNLQISDYQQTINGYSGRGVIKASDFFPKDINVAFDDIQINERNMVTGGAVRGLRKAAAETFPRVDAALQNSNIDEVLIDRMYDELLAPAAAMISDDLNEVVNDLEGSLSLPISFGDGEYKIHIPDMTFTANGATVSMLTGYEMEGDFIDGSKKLVFGSPEICITPGGLSLTDEILKLDILTPIDYAPSEVFALHINGAEGDNNSYIDIDCDGLNSIELNGHVSFSQEYVLGVNAQGDVQRNKKFATSFSASFTDWDEMIFTTQNDVQGLQGDLIFSSTFEVYQVPEFKFNFESMIIDLSEENNTDDMEFPFVATPNWTGTYIKTLELQFPDYFDQGNDNINLDISDLLIDDGGVSFDFMGSNLEELTDLSFGGWGTNINNVRLQIQRNNLVNASLSGDIRLPICENPIGLVGSMQKSQNQMDYDLTFDVREKWEVQMWACKFKCSDQSRLLTERINNEFTLKARLSGELELNDEIGEYDKIDIDRIRFEDMEFLTVAPYFRPGNFDIDAALNANFYGFNINLEDIDISEINRPNIQGKLPKISFDLGFKFGDKGGNGAGMYLSTDSRLNIIGKRNRDTGNYEFDAIELERIEIDSEVACVQLDGYLDIYRNHAIYGDGIGGGLRARFLGMSGIGAQLEADVLFGNMQNYDYWRVNVGAIFPGEGAPLGPISLKGLSGGVFYNMNQELDRNAEVGQTAATYAPRRGGWGFSAGTVWATVGEDNVMNGNVNLTVDFQPNGGLNNITLDGMAKMMDDPSFSRETIGNTEMLFDGNINYNHVRKSLNGSLGYRLDIPRTVSVINADKLENKAIEFNIDSPNDWNFDLGRPNVNGDFGDMLGFNLDLGVNIRKKFIGVRMGVNGYFNIGTSIPSMPPLPWRAREVVGDNFNYPQFERTGVGTGLHVAFETGKIKFGYDIAGLEISAYAGLGYDLSLQHKVGMLCNGRTDFGINNWYMEGRSYIYAGGSLYAKIFGSRYHIVSASVGAMLRFAGPDPYFASGNLRIRGKLPFIGWKTMNLGVTIGERCEFTALENQDEAFLNELAGVSVLGELQDLPNNDEVDFTDSNVKIQAEFFKKPQKEYSEFFSDGSMINYKIHHQLEMKEFIDGEWVRIATTDNINHIIHNSGLVQIFLNQDNENRRLLKPGRDFKLVVTGSMRYRTSYNGAFKMAKDIENKPLRIQRSYEFATTEIGDLELDILEITPSPGQENYHIEDAELDKGSFVLSNECLSILNNLDFREFDFVITFTEYYKGSTYPTGWVSRIESSDDQRAGASRILFGVGTLVPNRSYHMEIALQYEEDDPIPLYTQEFSTSKYLKLKTKLSNLDVSEIEPTNDGANGPSYVLKFFGDEKFETPYEDIAINFEYNVNSQWVGKRRILEAFAEEHGFLEHIKHNHPEFIPFNINLGSPWLVGIQNPINLNVNNPGGNTLKLKYLWNPNDYIVALRNYAIQHYAESIDRKDNYIFYDDYLPPEQRIPVAFKLENPRSGISRTVNLNF